MTPRQIRSLLAEPPTNSGAPARRRQIPDWAITALSVGALLVLWEVFGRRVNPIFGSYPSAIAVEFWQMTMSGELLSALWQSAQAFLVGFIAAVVVGVPSGLLIGRYRTLAAAFGPLITGGYAMPLVALVPLLMLWLGLGFAVKAAVVFLMAVFPIVINAWLGVRAAPKTLIEVGRSFVAPEFTILRRIILPATIPYVVAGVKLGVGRGVVGIIIAEFFTSISGLGGIIINSADNFDTARMFVPIITVMALAVALNGLITLIERRVAPWQAEMSGHDAA